MNKWICIKDYTIKDYTDLHIKVGDYVFIVDYPEGDIYLGMYGTDSVPMYEVNKKVYKHFVTMAEWREKQINSILDEDSNNKK